MKTRIIAAVTLTALLLGLNVFAGGDARSAKQKKAEISRLVAMLPASDGVVVFDSKRFVGEALPRILSGNQPMLAEVNARIAQMESATGIDLKKFDQVAVGVAIRKVGPTDVDFDSVALANGDINAGALLAVARLASKGNYREEKIGGKTAYVFSVKDIAATTAAPAGSKVAGVIDRALKGLTRDVAVVEMNRNTLAIGSLARIKDAIAGAAKPGADVTGLLSTREASILSFAVKTPGGIAQLISLDDDALGMDLNSIEYLSGALDVTPAGAAINLSARTRQPEKAQSLRDTLDGLKMVGGAVFGNSKRPDQQVYGRLIKDAKIEARGNDVSVDLPISQADIDSLLAIIK